MGESSIIIMLVVSGIIVGIINTLAGGGAIITMTLFTVLGLPIGVANGTNRIAVVLQNLTSSLTFLRKRMLNIKSGVKLSIPAIIGNVLGSMVATHISDTTFKICMAVVLTIVLVYMIFDNSHKHPHIHGGHALQIKPLHYLWFLLIGFYGGYIYIGLGYVILAVTIWSMKLDIITANVMNDQVDYVYGLWHGIGNVIGAIFASHFAINWGVKFVRYFTLIILIICFADLIGVISLHDILRSVLTVCN